MYCVHCICIFFLIMENFEDYQSSSYNFSPVQLSAKAAALQSKNPSLVQLKVKSVKRKNSGKTNSSPDLKTPKMTSYFKLAENEDSHSDVDTIEKGVSADIPSNNTARDKPPLESIATASDELTLPSSASTDSTKQTPIPPPPPSIETVLNVLSELKSLLGTTVEDIKDIKGGMEKDRAELKIIASNVRDLEQNHENILNRIICLEKSNSEITDKIDIEKIKDQIIPQVTASIESTFSGHWSESLKFEISQVETDIILSGAKPELVANCKLTEIFLHQNLKLGPEYDQKAVSVKSVKKLYGKNKVVIRLESKDERNSCLMNARYLSQGLKIDRVVPRRYISKYQQFKEKSWQLRSSQNVATKIEFGGHVLGLWIRKREEQGIKYDWVLHEEFKPKYEPAPTIAPTNSGKSRNNENFIPTPQINRELLSKTIIVSNIRSNLRPDETLTAFKAILSESNVKSIVSLKNGSKGIIVVICNTVNFAKTLARELNEIIFMDNKLKTAIPCL